MNGVDTTTKQYAEAVIAAYEATIADFLLLLPEYPTEQMRTYVTHEPVEPDGRVTRNWFSPIVHLGLIIWDHEPTISVARNFDIRWRVSQFQETALVRALFRRTMRENTAVDIEECIEYLEFVEKDHDEVYALAEQPDSGYRKFTVAPQEGLPPEVLPTSKN